ncbi:MAG: hypothetical protein KDD46_05725 [Bdellovibrionales bacterium]|nr:hypothetical protein [Bdellovibrionales bacterium]
MFTYIVCLFVAGSAFAQMGKTTEGLKDLQPGQKQEAKQEPVKEKSKPKSTTPAKTKPQEQTQSLSSGVILLNDQFFADAISQNWSPIVSYDSFLEIQKIVTENKEKYLSSNVYVDEFVSDGTKVHFFKKITYPSGKTSDSPAFYIDLENDVLVQMFVEYLLKNKKITFWIKESAVESAKQRNKVSYKDIFVILPEQSKALPFYSFISEVELSAETTKNETYVSFWKTDEGIKVQDSFMNYLDNVSEFYDDYYDCGEKAEDQPNKIKEYCKALPQSGAIYATCTDQASDENWHINLDDDISAKVKLLAKSTPLCNGGALWSEYLYQIFIGRDLSEFSSW